MASIVLTDEEWGVLANEPHHLLKLYVELRRRMDFRTRIVGIYPRLSEQSFREALYIEPKPGRKVSGSPTRKEYRHALECLVTLGLLEPLEEQGPLVFLLPKAFVDSSDQNQWGPNGARKGPEQGPNAMRTNNSNDNELGNHGTDNGAKGFSDYPAQRGLPRNPELRKNSNPIGLLVRSAAADDSEQPRKSSVPPCPHQQIIDLYHAILPANPRIRTWTAGRQAPLRARWNEDPKRQNLDWWRRFFERIHTACPFLVGQKTGSNGRPFLPGLEWIVKAENFAKILEGRYTEEAA